MTEPTEPTAAIEVWARMLCAADVHVHGDDHPTWRHLVGEPGRRVRDDYRKAAAWLLPRLTVSAGVAPATDQGALRKPAYDAVFAYLRKQPVDFLPVTIVGRNAMIWHAVHAALDAVLPAPAEEHRLALSEALGLGAGAPWDAIHDRATELGLPPLHRDPVARRLGLVAEHRATVLEKAADWFESDGRYVQQMFGHQAAAELRRMAAEPAPADTGHDDSETEGQAPPVCQGFVWIGQPFTTCDRCGQPAWEHAGEEVPVEGAGPFDNRRTVRPWKPGQTDAIRAKWAPEQPAAAQQPGEA